MTRMESSDLLMAYVHGLVQTGKMGPHKAITLARGFSRLYSSAQVDAFVEEFHPGKCPCGKRRCQGRLAQAIDRCLQWINKAQVQRVEGNNYVH